MEQLQLTTRAALLDALRGLQADIEGVVAAAGPARMEQPGSFGDWSCKDVLTHLTGWRELTAARLEAGFGDAAPLVPWPASLDEDRDIDAINAWFYESNRATPLDAVLADSRETFERCERAIAALPEDALFTPDHFPWLAGYALGPAVVRGTLEHFHEDHEPEIRAWLARG